METGDTDLYKAFVWRFWSLCSNSKGHVGIVLPRAALMTKGLEAYRRVMFDESDIQDITIIVNRNQWFFEDVHPQFTIGLVAYNKGAERNLVLRGPYSSFDRYAIGMTKSPVTFRMEDVLDWTDSASLPLLPSDESVEVFAQLREHPPLGLDQKNTWRARPYSELHATSAKKAGLIELLEEPPEGYWPVFKGESFYIWEPDKGVYYGWSDPQKVKEHLHDKRQSRRSVFTEFPRDVNQDESTLQCLHPRIAFQNNGRATDRRTIKAALLPPNVFISNAAPYFLWPRGDKLDEAYLLGVLSSIPLDWYARRFIELNVSLYILNTFPVPRPERTNPLWKRVVELAGRLAAVDDRYAEWADAVGVEYGPLDLDEKDTMIFELDAVVAHLYGLSEDQLTHIFKTFHEGWDYKPRLNAVLTHYRRWSS